MRVYGTNSNLGFPVKFAGLWSSGFIPSACRFMASLLGRFRTSRHKPLASLTQALPDGSHALLQLHFQRAKNDVADMFGELQAEKLLVNLLTNLSAHNLPDCLKVGLRKGSVPAVVNCHFALRQSRCMETQYSKVGPDLGREGGFGALRCEKARLRGAKALGARGGRKNLGKSYEASNGRQGISLECSNEALAPWEAEGSHWATW